MYLHAIGVIKVTVVCKMNKMNAVVVRKKLCSNHGNAAFKEQHKLKIVNKVSFTFCFLTINLMRIRLKLDPLMKRRQKRVVQVLDECFEIEKGYSMT